MRLTKLLDKNSPTAEGAITPKFVKAFNKDVLVRLYPNSEDRHTNKLVGVKRVAEIVGTKSVFQGMIDRLDNCEDQRLTVFLRRGISFTFIIR